MASIKLETDNKNYTFIPFAIRVQTNGYITVRGKLNDDRIAYLHLSSKYNNYCKLEICHTGLWIDVTNIL